MIGTSLAADAEGHRSGESGAGYVALGTIVGSLGIAILFVVVGAVIGAVVGATRAGIWKAVVWGGCAGTALVGLPPLLWAVKATADLAANGPFTFTVTGIVAFAGAVGGATAGFVAAVTGKMLK